MKKWVKLVLQWGFTFSCASFIGYYFWSNWSDLKTVFNFNCKMILLIMGIQVTFLLLQSYRNLIVLEECSGVRIPFLFWFKLFILGRFLNKFIPQLGNAYRSVWLKSKLRVSYTSYVSGYFSFAWMDVLFNLLLGLAVIMCGKSEIRLGTIKVEYFFIVAIIAIGSGPFLINVLFQFIHFRRRSLVWIYLRVSEILSVSVSNFLHWQYTLKFALSGGMVFVQTVVLLYVCFLMLDIHVTVSTVVIFFILLKLIGYVSITPGNLGIQEIAAGILGQLMDIGMAQGIVVSMVLRILSYVVLLALGSLYGGISLLRSSREYLGGSKVN